MTCGPTPCVERPPAFVGMLGNSPGNRWILAATVFGSSMGSSTIKKDPPGPAQSDHEPSES
jgi:hypothetical protein